MKRDKTKFKVLKYPFLVDIVVDNEHIISLNSDNLRMKICGKRGNKMVGLLEIAGSVNGNNSRIEVTTIEKAHKVLFHTGGEKK